jgi:twitching motility two-component system response regulator PilH
MLTAGNRVTSRKIIDLHQRAGYLRVISPHQRNFSLARKILLADDSVTAQNMGRKILADAGYEVIAVNNGSAALKKIAELKPDLVILDVYMPGYSGLEVCQRLKESQDTARIPVLLSVGKLEPFKPEEAQRVRADAFIVKPFEASELLSALSKLEDKVVPRAEPSKPGRFARAMAAAEESSRGSRKETDGDKNGWNSRIGFPHAKTEAEEKVSDESTIYNPMNRDLRTVVETAGEKAAEKAAEQKEEKHQPVAQPETSVDVAALAPAGLPKDVTPEEVAAITAAAAQIHMAGAGVKGEHFGGGGTTSETEIPGVQNSGIQNSGIQDFTVQASGAQVSEPASVASFEPPSDRVEESIATHVAAEAATEISQAHETAVPEVEPRVDSVNTEETQDQPVTMAVATAESVAAVSAGGPRWMAVPVALEGEESTISLEEEMQKAYAAYAAYVSAEPESGGVAVAQEAEPVARENSYSPEAAAPDVVAPVVAAPDIVAPEIEAAPAENLSSAEVATFEEDAQAAPGAEVVEASAIAVSVVESVGSSEEMVIAEAAGTAAPEVQESQPQEPQPTMEAEPAAAGATVAAGDAVVPVDEHAAEYKPDSDTVKSTAAAWASWRQIRDTHKDGEAVPAQSREFEVSEPVPAETARAVAAGAEQMMQEAAAPPNGEPVDVASIVESVLANLRPKLMEEISRKMSEKK